MINKKIIIISIILILSLVFVLAQTIFANDDETIIYFYSPSCPACIELEKHEEFKDYLEDMKVKKIDVSKLTGIEKEFYQLIRIPSIYHIKKQEKKQKVIAAYTGIQDILNSINE